MDKTKIERIRQTLRGEAVDRPPIAFWQHFPGDDQDPDALAAATLNFQKRFDFDFVKLTPSNAHAAADWGSKSAYLGNGDGLREFNEYAIKQPRDWKRLIPLDVKSGVLGQHLKCISILRRELGESTPLIASVFNPLFVARTLAGPNLVVASMRETPGVFQDALEAISETMRDFAREAINSGADGIFLATLHATYQLLSDAEYQTFGVPYDAQILEAADEGWFNVLHIHAGNNIMFRLLADYPVHAINWHDRETWPSLAEAREFFNGTLVGGLSRYSDLVQGSPEQVRAQVADAIYQTNGLGLIIGAGCVLPLTVPQRNIDAAIEAARI